MTEAQRARRIRQLDARREALNAELRAIEAEAAPLEREHSRSLGFGFPPLRGKALLDVMDREGRKAA
jgi:hypothetical protein